MLIGTWKSAKGNGSKFQNGDILFARITPCLENGKTDSSNFFHVQDSVAFRLNRVYCARDPASVAEYVYLMARSSEFENNAIKSMSGATGRHVSKSVFRELHYR